MGSGSATPESGLVGPGSSSGATSGSLIATDTAFSLASDELIDRPTWRSAALQRHTVARYTLREPADQYTDGSDHDLIHRPLLQKVHTGQVKLSSYAAA